MVESDKLYFMAPVTERLVVEQPNNALHPTPSPAFTVSLSAGLLGRWRG